MTKSSHRRNARTLGFRFQWSALEDRRLPSGLGLQLTLPTLVAPAELAQVTAVIDESPTIDVRVPIVGSLSESIPIVRDLVPDSIADEDDEDEDGGAAGPDASTPLPSPVVMPEPIVEVPPAPAPSTPEDPPAGGLIDLVPTPTQPVVTIEIPTDPTPPISADPAVTPVIVPEVTSPAPIGPEDTVGPEPQIPTPTTGQAPDEDPQPGPPLFDVPSTGEVPVVTRPPATSPVETPRQEVAAPESHGGDHPASPPSSGSDAGGGSSTGADPSRPDRPTTPPIESPPKSSNSVVPPTTPPASSPSIKLDSAKQDSAKAPAPSSDEAGVTPTKSASAVSDTSKASPAPAPSAFAGSSGERSGTIMSTPVAWTSSVPAGHLAPGGGIAGSWPDDLHAEATLEPLGLTPFLSAASSAATLAAPSAFLAEIAASDTYEATRNGMELAIAVATNLADSLPRISSEALAIELDSATSMVRAALDPSQLDAIDVSGLVREMGELIASVRSHSVGRLVQMAALSPVTWILLGVLAVVSAEIARRELRNSASEPPGGGCPDLLASWEIG